MPSSERRRQVAYYFGLGWLGGIESGRDCATIAELSEGIGKDATRIMKRMVKDGTCPEHAGNYRVTRKFLDSLGLP